MAEFNESVIDHLDGDDWCGISTGEMALRNKLERLAAEYPDKVECIAKNEDGSVYYHVPWKWVNIKSPRVVSEEERKRLSDLSKSYSPFRNKND